VSSNIGKERGSQPQHPQTESSSTVPNQQHCTDPLITRETGQQSLGYGLPSFPHLRPVIAYVPVQPGEVYNSERSPHLPQYEPGPPGVPVTRDGTASRSDGRIPSGVHDEPKKLPGKEYPVFSSPPLNLTGIFDLSPIASLVLDAPHHGDDQGHMDRPDDEIKQLLLPTRGDAIAAVCPPPAAAD
jgi:hypothetical protein